MAIEVRSIREQDVEPWVRAMRAGFLGHAADGEAEYLRSDMDLDRTWGAFERDQVVGTLRSFATTLTVPGPGAVRAAALTNVTVAPTHRRQGTLRRMITPDLRAARDRGEAVGILIASEFPIYGRFGYGPAVEAAGYSMDASRARFRQSAPGRVELVDPGALRKEAPALYEQFRRERPGAIERSERWWDRTLHQVEVPGRQPRKGFQAVYRSEAGRAEGYVMYTARQQWDQMLPDAVLDVEELVATTPAAYRRLWQYCCEVDLVTRVQAGNRSVDEPLPLLLTDGRLVRQTGRYDFVWVRPLDVASALGARRYPAEGQVVLEVTDELGLSGGRFLLEGGPDGAGCAATAQSPDLTMTAGALGSAYLGGVTLHTLVVAGQVDVHRPRALAAADAMFRAPVAPWCTTWF